jgi:hypothetical protein
MSKEIKYCQFINVSRRLNKNKIGFSKLTNAIRATSCIQV